MVFVSVDRPLMFLVPGRHPSIIFILTLGILREFEELFQLFEPRLSTSEDGVRSRRHKLNPRSRLCMLLYYLGHYPTLSTIAAVFSVALSTASAEIRSLLSIGRDVLAGEISWPNLEERKQLHGKIFGFPDAIGVVDCTISRRHRSGYWQLEFYRGDKHVCFVNTLIVCDYRGRMIHVQTGYPGRGADQNCYNNSDLFLFEDYFFDGNETLLCDGGFSGHRLISPLPADLVEEEEALIPGRKLHSRQRAIVENVNAFLKRYRVTSAVSRHSYADQTTSIFVACLIANKQLKSQPLRPER